MRENSPSYACGACYCRAIAFRVAMPVHGIWNCHCKQCQRLHGAPYVTWAGFETADYRISDPEDLMRFYNSGHAGRGFCGRCGSSFFFRYDGDLPRVFHPWRNYVYFARASFDAPLSRPVDSHIYFDARADWVKTFDDIPAYEEGSE